MAKSVSVLGAELASLSGQFEEALKRQELLYKEREEKWAEIDRKVAQISAQAPAKIVLDVGGKRFATSKNTLLSMPDTFFTGMLCSEHWKPNDDGAYFIDRNPKHFNRILDFLRSGNLRIADLSPEQLECLQDDLDFYQLNPPTKPTESWDKIVFLASIEYAISQNGKTVRRKRSGHTQAIRLDKELLLEKSYEWSIRLDVIENSYWLALGVGSSDTVRFNDFFGLASDGQAYPGNLRTDVAGDWLAGDIIQVVYKYPDVTVSNTRTGKGQTMTVDTETTMYPFFDVYEDGLTITLVDFKETS